MEVEALASLTQFGVAGLIGWMWIVERRAAAVRDRQVQEAHDRMLSDKTRLEVLVQALRENTRALTALEVGQRGFIALLERFGVEGQGGPGGAGP